MSYVLFAATLASIVSYALLYRVLGNLYVKSRIIILSSALFGCATTIFALTSYKMYKLEKIEENTKHQQNLIEEDEEQNPVLIYPAKTVKL